METSVETKVPFYSVVNIFLPGIVLLGACILLFLDNVKTTVSSLTTLGSAGLEVLVSVACLALAYEVGYILFRFGALVIEPCLKMLFGWTDYSLFVSAKKAGAKSLDMLSREYAYARTQITLFIALAVATGISKSWTLMVACIICVILFVLTARGHMKKITTTVKCYISDEKTDSIILTDKKG